MTEMFGEAWPPMSVPDLAPDDDDDIIAKLGFVNLNLKVHAHFIHASSSSSMADP